jgi:5-hydroxyisourate hydrolase
MSTITTHVLDAVLGKPAAGIAVRLEKQQDAAWVPVHQSATDADGRCRDLSGDVTAGDATAGDATEGRYRLTFSTSAYLEQKGRNSIYPEISIEFLCDGRAHYHLPLLLSDNSYTTYRGS